ncbi:MAG: MarR family transcriptional regulator [Candidatus Heimdallarchaeota archaeon]
MSNKGTPLERPDILKLTEEISNFFEDIMYDRGGSPLLGRIYALCVLTAPSKPLLQKDLVTKFNVNPSTISRNLKELETWRLIDRRREPGSREWNYQVDPTSFLELLVNRFQQNAVTLRERRDDLKRIREHWGHTLSKESKQTEEGKRVLHVLNFLIEWIAIVEGELESFVQTLHNRFFELERQIKKQI